MENINTSVDQKYPIGQFLKQDNYSAKELLSLISTIEEVPERYRSIVTLLSEESLLKTYRPGSWNIRQLVHHVADIQLLHYLRMKKALTENDYKDVTLINMDGWANTADGLNAPVDDSLLMLEGITKRYVYLIRSLNENDLALEYFHPVRKFTVNQAQAIAMSAWHLEHHLAHIKLALK